MVRNEEGTYSYMARAHDVPLDQVNMSEKEAFQSGRKLVAVISNAASTGISLQARASHASAGSALPLWCALVLKMQVLRELPLVFCC